MIKMNKETFVAVDKYYEELLIDPDPRFDHINQAAEAAGLPAIQVSALQGKFLQLIALMQSSKRVLEIGTLAGYSTAWLASGLTSQAKLVTLEIDPHHAAIAEKNLTAFDFPCQVEILVGDGLQLAGQRNGRQSGAPHLVFVHHQLGLGPALG